MGGSVGAGVGGLVACRRGPVGAFLVGRRPRGGVRRPLVLALLAVTALPGCASDEGAFSFARDASPLEPYYRESREVLSGEHAKVFDVPVEALARLVNVTVELDARRNGLPMPDATLARLDVRLVDPAGAILREARLDPRTPAASLVAEDVPPGLYRVEVEGFGASQDFEGQTYGAAYVLAVEVVYPE